MRAKPLYNLIYAPGTYQNKPFRPGNYVFWIAHAFDTTGLPNGAYRLSVFASDTRSNVGTTTVDLTIAFDDPPWLTFSGFNERGMRVEVILPNDTR